MIKRLLASLSGVLALGAVLALPAVVMSPSVASAQTANCGKDTYFKIQYNFGANGSNVDEGCAKQNDINQTTNPGLIATKLHVSCSDKFVGGVPQKGDLGNANRRVVAWFISKDGGKKTCGVGTPVPAGGVAGEALLLAGAAVVVVGGGVLLRRKTTARAAA